MSPSESKEQTKGPGKERLMTGVRVTGPLHIGHYWGTLRNWKRFQDEYDCFFGVMDWHGMTSAYKKSSLVADWTADLFAEYLAWGVDPEKSTVFVQSQVPEHLELYWIFANLTPMGWLERVPTWKDAEEEAKQSDTHNLGRFSYPVLQAADIAMYLGRRVPVGADQVSHLELSREIIRRFNHIYKGKLVEPLAILTETPSIPGMDGRKMSKSYDNFVLLTEESEKALKKKVNAMVTDPQRVHRTDPGDPLKCSVYGYHRLYSVEDLNWVEEGCRSAGIGCGDCKAKLAANMEKISAEPRMRKQALLADRKKLKELIEFGNEKARKEARKTLELIRSSMKW
jgi:tryptophanyl-tRNA synthetase